jgi:hypothetical protein
MDALDELTQQPITDDREVVTLLDRVVREGTFVPTLLLQDVQYRRLVNACIREQLRLRHIKEFLDRELWGVEDDMKTVQNAGGWVEMKMQELGIRLMGDGAMETETDTETETETEGYIPLSPDDRELI